MAWCRIYLSLNTDLFPSQSPCNVNFLSCSTSSYCHHNYFYYFSSKAKVIIVTALNSRKKDEQFTSEQSAAGLIHFNSLTQ